LSQGKAANTTTLTTNEAPLYSIDGKKKGSITLPKVFETPVEPEIIRRAVISIQTARLQPKGVKPDAGRDTSAEYRGNRRLPYMERTINVGVARLPRMKNRRYLLAGRVAKVPQAVGGPRAHPPKPEKKIVERINKKEKRLALMSAIAATAKPELVKKRHNIGDITLPVIIEEKFAELKKTKEVTKVLEALGLMKDVLTAKEKKKVRAGKGKLRGRRYKRKKSLLIVTAEPASIYLAARNLEGVEIVPVNQLNAEVLAPGGEAGRLVVWTEQAIQKLEEMFNEA
jgi:large subunit ribosomal protein L4e